MFILRSPSALAKCWLRVLHDHLTHAHAQYTPSCMPSFHMAPWWHAPPPPSRVDGRSVMLAGTGDLHHLLCGGSGSPSKLRTFARRRLWPHACDHKGIKTLAQKAVASGCAPATAFEWPAAPHGLLRSWATSHSSFAGGDVPPSFVTQTEHKTPSTLLSHSTSTTFTSSATSSHIGRDLGGAFGWLGNAALLRRELAGNAGSPGPIKGHIATGITDNEITRGLSPLSRILQIPRHGESPPWASFGPLSAWPWLIRSQTCRASLLPITIPPLPHPHQHSSPLSLPLNTHTRHRLHHSFLRLPSLNQPW